jgi:hypothetical protein
MTGSRAILLGGLFGLTAASGCAQLAGLTDDYHLASAGVGGEPASSVGGSAAGGHGGSSGHTSASTDAGAAGEIDGEAGASESGGQPTTGGDSGTGGSENTAGSSHGGVGGSSTSGSGGSAGSGGLGGSGGGSSVSGPTNVGFSLFHDSAFGNDNASSHLADASFSKPPGTAAGDLILVFFGADHGLSNLGGSELHNLGWELIDQHADLGTDGQGTYLLYKIATGNEPDPIVFKEINSPGGGNGVQGLLSVYRGVKAMAPINAYEANPVDTGSDGTSFVNDTPAITTTVPNCLLIAGLSPDTTVDRPVVDSWPDGFTENKVSVVNAPNPYPLGWANIYSVERHVPNAGTVPASAFTWHVTNKTGGGTYYGYLTFVLALAPAN